MVGLKACATTAAHAERILETGESRKLYPTPPPVAYKHRWVCQSGPMLSILAVSIGACPSQGTEELEVLKPLVEGVAQGGEAEATCGQSN